jgi:hypothetical protein
MNRDLRSRLAMFGRPVLGPLRRQIYAWIDYRIEAARNAPDAAQRTWTQSSEKGAAPVTFAEVVPKLLNAISASNAWAREGKRQQDAIIARLDALESKLAGDRSEQLANAADIEMRWRTEHGTTGTVLHLSSAGAGETADPSHLPFGPDSLAEIRIEQLLEFLPASIAATTLLPQLRRALKPGGHIVVSVADAATVMSAAAANQRSLEALEKALHLDARPLRSLYDQHRLNAVLSEAGFTVRNVAPASCNPDVLVAVAD